MGWLGALVGSSSNAFFSSIFGGDVEGTANVTAQTAVSSITGSVGESYFSGIATSYFGGIATGVVAGSVDGAELGTVAEPGLGTAAAGVVGGIVGGVVGSLGYKVGYLTFTPPDAYNTDPVVTAFDNVDWNGLDAGDPKAIQALEDAIDATSSAGQVDINYGYDPAFGVGAVTPYDFDPDATENYPAADYTPDTDADAAIAEDVAAGAATSKQVTNACGAGSECVRPGGSRSRSWPWTWAVRWRRAGRKAMQSISVACAGRRTWSVSLAASRAS